MACRHSRGYLRHLFQANEMLGPMLVSIHNLTYYQRLLAEARQAIAADRFAAFLAQRRRGWEWESQMTNSRMTNDECRIPAEFVIRHSIIRHSPGAARLAAPRHPPLSVVALHLMMTAAVAK